MKVSVRAQPLRAFDSAICGVAKATPRYEAREPSQLMNIEWLLIELLNIGLLNVGVR